MPEYLLCESTVCAHVQTSIKYDYDLLSIYANFISALSGSLTVNGNEQLWIVLSGHNGLLHTWIKKRKDLHYCCYCYNCDFFFDFGGQRWRDSKDICNAKNDLDSAHWDDYDSPLTSSSWPLISACFLSSNEQTHAAAFKTRGKYLLNWSWIS